MQFCAAIFLGLVTLMTAPNPTQRPKSDEVFIKQLSGRLAAASSAADRKALSRMLADDYIVTHPHGEIETKSTFINRIEPAAEGAKTKAASSDFIVRIYGNTALLNFRCVISGLRQPDNKPFSVPTRITEIFVKRGKSWQIAARHESIME